MKSIKYIFFSIIVFASLASSSDAQEVRVARIEGGKKHACLLKAPSNLLISLAKRKVGKVLDFNKELSSTSKKIKKTNSSIAALKGKSDSVSKNKRNKLKKARTNLKLLSKGIIACRDGLTSQSLPVDCAGPLNTEGTPCDDLNPCTGNDKCINLKCTGTALTDSTILKCSFDKCSLEIQQCANSKFTACIIGAAGSEICNGVDDDCNGEIDEKNVCSVTTSEPTATISASNTGSPAPTLNPTITPGQNLPTATFTSTSTATRTFTATFTSTATSTRTATNTATRTFTPTRTSTRTPTPTPTPAFTVKCTTINNGAGLNPSGCGCNSNLDCSSGICVTKPPAAVSNICAIDHCSTTNNNLDLSPDGCPCSSSNDCKGSCAGGSCIGGGGPGCVIPGNARGLSEGGCPCISNLDCVQGICPTGTKICAVI